MAAGSAGTFSAFSRAGVGGMLFGTLVEAAMLTWLRVGDFNGACPLMAVSAPLGVGAGAFCVVGWTILAGNDGIALGDVVALPLGTDVDTEGESPALPLLWFVAPGGGGSGAIPRTFLSLAAAAAAADAYLRVSPGARVGKGAGFMLLFVIPLAVEGRDVCRVARAGSGDFN